MAIIKLVCQGCGANLDALDNQRVLVCGYCEASNQIKQTVHEQPIPKRAARPARPRPQFQPPVQIYHPQASAHYQARGRGYAVFIVVMVMFSLTIGGVIAFIFAHATNEVIEQVRSQAPGSGSSYIPPATARKYSWLSDRPMLIDVNGDGTEDIVGSILVHGSNDVLLTVMSGTNYATLWEAYLCNSAEISSGNPRLYWEPGKQLLLAEYRTPELIAFDVRTGRQVWSAKFTDVVDTVARDGDQLWIRATDEAGFAVALADGKSTPSQAPSEAATLLRDDHGYELIPELRSPNLKFADLRVEQNYCPAADLPFATGRRNSEEAKRCAHARGLAFATRAKGSAVPFWVGYDQATKAERWRGQLTEPGTIDTVETGFEQPRAELHGDEAVVAFMVNKEDVSRIRRMSLVDGSVMWETTLPAEAGSNIDGMVVGKSDVIVTQGRDIHVLNYADGQRKVVLGY